MCIDKIPPSHASQPTKPTQSYYELAKATYARTPNEDVKAELRTLDGEIAWADENPSIYCDRAQLRFVLGYPAKDVLADFESALFQDPDDSRTYYAFGAVLGLSHDYLNRIYEYLSRLQLGQTSTVAYIERAYMYGLLGDEAGAIADLTSACERGYDGTTSDFLLNRIRECQAQLASGS